MKISFRRFYALLVVLGPILTQYSIGGQLDLDLLLFLLVVLISVIGGFHSKGTQKNGIILFLIYVVLVTAVNLLIGRHYSSTSDIILRCGKYCLVMFFILIVDIDYFDYDIAMSIYKKVAYATFAFIVLQTIVFYATGRVLSGVIGESGRVITYAGVGRLSAFYSEPAALSYGLMPFTVCSLFGRPYRGCRSQMADALISSGAIALSTSGQGIICLGVVWALWLLYEAKHYRISTSKFIGLFLFLIVAVYFSTTSILASSLGRVTVEGSGNAVSARSSGYAALQVLNPVQRIFGTGYGNYIVRNRYGIDTPYAYIYYPTFAEYLFTTGLIGSFMLLRLFFRRFRRGALCTRVMIIATAVLSFGGAPLAGALIPLYFSFLFCSMDERDEGGPENVS